MKGAILAALATIALAAAAIGISMVVSRGHGSSSLNPDELAWIARFYHWRGGPANQTCRHEGRAEASGRLPVAPTARLREAERVARAACGGTTSWARADRAVKELLVSGRALPTYQRVDDASHIDPVLGGIASRIAKRRVQARCWSEHDWYRVNIERQTITGQTHFWASGIAEPGIAHLDGPLVCEPLARFYEEGYTPGQNNERSVLATALVVLSHEAEHNYSFRNSEAVVECFAVQDVRSLVEDAGRSEAFAADIAGYAWDVSYIRGDPVYSTGRCRNNGPLDIYPDDDLWP